MAKQDRPFAALFAQASQNILAVLQRSTIPAVITALPSMAVISGKDCEESAVSAVTVQETHFAAQDPFDS